MSKDIKNLGGSGLVDRYNGSLYELLSSVYSENEWLPWLFVNVPVNFWGDIENQRVFVNWVAKELNIHKMSDWYNVTQRVINSIERFQCLRMYSELELLEY
jgi:hypothetical protein